MDQAILERIKSNMFPEESQDQPTETVTSEDQPQEAEADVPMALVESEEAAEAEETSETVELATETEDLAEESQEPEKWTLDEVAESLDTSVEELLNDWEIDVEGNKVKLGELKRGTLRESDYTKKTQALAEERRTFEAERKAHSDKFESELSVLGQLIQGAEQLFMHDYNQADMDNLKQDDPSEWSVKDREFENRAKQINQLKQYGREQYEKYVSEQQNASKEDAPKQREKLLDKIPDFKDSSKFTSGMEGITNYLSELGYSNDELANLYDHRPYVMAYEAMKYRELQSKRPEIEQKAKSVPKVLKPKGRKPKEAPEVRKKQDLRKRLKKSGSIDDFAALIRTNL